MSFLSSHRLHWGVHHELSDNFLVQLERIVHDANTNTRAEAGSPSPDDPAHAAGLIPPADSQPEALGP